VSLLLQIIYLFDKELHYNTQFILFVSFGLKKRVGNKYNYPCQIIWIRNYIKYISFIMQVILNAYVAEN
jgi:hypothetical protein